MVFFSPRTVTCIPQRVSGRRVLYAVGLCATFSTQFMGVWDATTCDSHATRREGCVFRLGGVLDRTGEIRRDPTVYLFSVLTHILRLQPKPSPPDYFASFKGLFRF